MRNDRRRRHTRWAEEQKRKRWLRLKIAVAVTAIAAVAVVAMTGVTQYKKVQTLGSGMEAETQETEEIATDGTEILTGTETAQETETSTEDTENQETVTAEAGGVTGRVIILDAGHGGKDQGCAYGEVLEKDINLEIVLLLRQRLEDAGFTVIMTRDDDTFVYLNRRVEAAENADADAFVSIHVDSYTDDESVQGLTVHYETGADGGMEFADSIHSALSEAGITKVRSLMESDLYVLRNTTMPATLVEVGFLTNSTDRTNLLSETFQEELADSICSGIIAYFSENGDNS
jgi:N-acetylmuramoyl-L-alanine amidase